jgi:hypothetical protein
LEQLDPDQQRQICEWLLTPGLGTEKIKALVKKKFKVSTNWSALDSFYQLYVAPYLMKRREQVMGVAEQLEKEVRKAPGQFDKITIDALERKAFELANNPMVDAASLKSIYTLLLKARDQEIKAMQLNLSKGKFAASTCALFIKWSKDKEANRIVKSNISDEEKIKLLRKKYFADVDALQESGEIELPS